MSMQVLSTKAFTYAMIHSMSVFAINVTIYSTGIIFPLSTFTTTHALAPYNVLASICFLRQSDFFFMELLLLLKQIFQNEIEL